MSERHEYRAGLVWTGARQGPTSSYQSYSREYEFHSEGKPVLLGSADPQFRGDASRHNPEELLVMALASCHLLSYLAQCARNGVHVVSYEDQSVGVMAMRDGKLRFVDVLLCPQVVISETSDLEKARALHEKAHADCYVANSVNFPVRHEAIIATSRCSGRAD